MAIYVLDTLECILFAIYMQQIISQQKHCLLYVCECVYI